MFFVFLIKFLHFFQDLAYKLDPRVQKYKDEEKRRKEQEKLAKEEIRRAKVEEEERIKKEAADAEKREKDLQEEARKQLVRCFFKNLTFYLKKLQEN